MTGIRSCEVGGGAGKACPRQLEHPQAVHMAGIDGCECVARMVAAGGQHTLVAIERRGLQCVSNNGAHAPAARGMELWAAGDSTRIVGQKNREQHATGHSDPIADRPVMRVSLALARPAVQARDSVARRPPTGG